MSNLHNLFEQTNSFVPKQMVSTTISKALADLFPGSLHYVVVGNINKDVAGDIDIAIHEESLRQITGFYKHQSSYTDFWDYLKNWLYTYSKFDYVINKGFKQISFSVPLFEQSDKKIWEGVENQAWARDKDGSLANPLNLAWVQLDVLVGDANWMKDFLSGPGEGSHYKALYRNALIKAVVYQKFLTTDNGLLGYHMIDFRKGIKYRLKTEDGKGEATDTLVISDANLMANLFFNVPSWEDINSFEKVISLIRADTWVGPKKSSVIKAFVAELTKKKINIPIELFEKLYE